MAGILRKTKFPAVYPTLSHILETAVDVEAARHMLNASSLAHSSWEIENWTPYMVETALAIAQKWKQGFA